MFPIGHSPFDRFIKNLLSLRGASIRYIPLYEFILISFFRFVNFPEASFCFVFPVEVQHLMADIVILKFILRRRLSVWIPWSECTTETSPYPDSFFLTPSSSSAPASGLSYQAFHLFAFLILTLGASLLCRMPAHRKRDPSPEPASISRIFPRVPFEEMPRISGIFRTLLLMPLGF